jgi:hypothetical protein
MKICSFLCICVISIFCHAQTRSPNADISDKEWQLILSQIEVLSHEKIYNANLYSIPLEGCPALSNEQSKANTLNELLDIVNDNNQKCGLVIVVSNGGNDVFKNYFFIKQNDIWVKLNAT